MKYRKNSYIGKRKAYNSIFNCVKHISRYSQKKIIRMAIKYEEFPCT